jgi:hypothetical protein
MYWRDLLTRCINSISIIYDVFGSVPKIRKATISFVVSASLSVRLSVRMEQFGFHWTTFFHESGISVFFGKSVEKIQVSLTSNKNNGT